MTRSIQPSTTGWAAQVSTGGANFSSNTIVLSRTSTMRAMAESDIAGLGGLAQLEAQPRMGDVDLLLDAQRRGRIDERLGGRSVSGSRCPAARSSTSRVLGAATGMRQPAGSASAAVSGTSIGVGQRAVGRDVERRAVRHDAGGAAQGELALLGEVAVDLEVREAPRIGRDVPDPALDQMLEIAVALLQVMRPQEQAFRPDDLAVPGHRRPVPALRCDACVHRFLVPLRS